MYLFFELSGNKAVVRYIMIFHAEPVLISKRFCVDDEYVLLKGAALWLSPIGNSSHKGGC